MLEYENVLVPVQLRCVLDRRGSTGAQCRWREWKQTAPTRKAHIEQANTKRCPNCALSERK